MKVVSEPTRMKILEFLTGGEKCVCEIIPYAKKKQSNVSIQLKKLEDAGVISSRKEGKKVFYKIVDYRVCEIFNIINFARKNVIKQCCCKGC